MFEPLKQFSRLAVVLAASASFLVGCSDGGSPSTEANPEELWEDAQSIYEIMALPPEALPPELREGRERTAQMLANPDRFALSPEEERTELLGLDPAGLPPEIQEYREVLLQDLEENWRGVEDLLALTPKAFPREVRREIEESMRIVANPDRYALSPEEERAELFGLDPAGLPPEIRELRQSLGPRDAELAAFPGTGVAANDDESDCWVRWGSGYRAWLRYSQCKRRVSAWCPETLDEHPHSYRRATWTHAMCWW